MTLYTFSTYYLSRSGSGRLDFLRLEKTTQKRYFVGHSIGDSLCAAVERETMRRIIQVMSVSAAILALAVRPVMGDDLKSHEFWYEYLAGDYLAIGKELNSDKTYYGKVLFSHEKDRLTVIRDIEGETVKGEGRIEHALGPDEANVLRVRFVRAGQEYEITYIWRSDLDNYPRLSGHLYQPGKQTDSPGLEALFIEHTKR